MPMDFPSVRSCTFMPSYPTAGRCSIVPPCTPPDEARSTSAFGAELGEVIEGQVACLCRYWLEHAKQMCCDCMTCASAVSDQQADIS